MPTPHQKAYVSAVKSPATRESLCKRQTVVRYFLELELEVDSHL